MMYVFCEKTGILLITLIGVSCLPYKENVDNLDFGNESRRSQVKPSLQRLRRTIQDSDGDFIESRFGSRGHSGGFGSRGHPGGFGFYLPVPPPYGPPKRHPQFGSDFDHPKFPCGGHSPDFHEHHGFDHFGHHQHHPEQKPNADEYPPKHTTQELWNYNHQHESKFPMETMKTSTETSVPVGTDNNNPKIIPVSEPNVEENTQSNILTGRSFETTTPVPSIDIRSDI